MLPAQLTSQQDGGPKMQQAEVCSAPREPREASGDRTRNPPSLSHWESRVPHNPGEPRRQPLLTLGRCACKPVPVLGPE